MNAKQFYAFCKARGACGAGLKAIKGLSLQEWWATTDRADWMLWLMGCGKFDKATYVRIDIGLTEADIVRDIVGYDEILKKLTVEEKLSKQNTN